MTSMEVKFPARVELRGINPFVLVGRDDAERLAPYWRKPIPVRARLNGKPAEGWLVNMMPVGNGAFYLFLNGEARSTAGVSVGDRVDVTLTFASDYKSGPAELPPAFRRALSFDENAKRGWEVLSASRQKEIVRYIAGLKSQEALNRNIERALYVIAGGAVRFMARDWNAQSTAPAPRVSTANNDQQLSPNDAHDPSTLAPHRNRSTQSGKPEKPRKRWSNSKN